MMDAKKEATLRMVEDATNATRRADDRCEKLADLADRIRNLANKEDGQCQ